MGSIAITPKSEIFSSVILDLWYGTPQIDHSECIIYYFVLLGKETKSVLNCTFSRERDLLLRCTLTFGAHSRILVDVHGLADGRLDELQLKRDFLDFLAEGVLPEDGVQPVQGVPDLHRGGFKLHWIILLKETFSRH